MPPLAKQEEAGMESRVQSHPGFQQDKWPQATGVVGENVPNQMEEKHCPVEGRALTSGDYFPEIVFGNSCQA